MAVIEYIGSIGGIAGVLAVLMFLAYRYLVNQMREDRRFMEDRLTHVLDDYNQAFKDNTQMLSELYTWLKARNGGSK